MADKSTFIKLDRNIQDWRWYGNGNTFRAFIHILLNANVKRNGFEGIEVQRGQLVTSYPNMSKALTMSIQEIRTAINHLKSTGELTVKIYPKFSLFTVVNYELYQGVSTGKSTGNQQAVNSQATGNQQQYKNDKNDKNVRSSSSELPPPTQNDIFSFAAENDLSNVDCIQFFTYYDGTGWKTSRGKPITDWQSLLIRWNKTEKVKPKENQESIAAYDLDLFEKTLNERN